MTNRPEKSDWVTHIPTSSTAKSGIAVGDVLLEFEGLVVPGAKGDTLKKLQAALQKQAAVGDHRRLKLRRANGDVVTWYPP